MMVLIGDILNWLAAGVLFPLMLLPLAGLLTRGNAITGSAIWLVLVTVTTAVGALFADLAPRLDHGAAQPRLTIFSGLSLTLFVLIAFAGGPRTASARLAPFFDMLTRRAGRTVMWLLLAMALVQFALVILRYVFGVNFIFMQESVIYMHGAVFLLAAGYALLTDDHVRVDIFYREASARRKALVDLAGTYLFLLPVCLLILWASSDYVSASWAVLEGSTEQSGIKGVFLLKSLIPAFAALLLVAGFVVAARAAETLRNEGA